MASNGPMVLCDNLVKIYKVQDLEVVALQGLDLVVERGEFMAIIGPSGSGKSSLMNILGGLDRPSAGKAIVDGIDLLKASSMALTTYRREKVGFVWQQPSRNLIPYLSVVENVELPMIIAGAGSKARKAWSQELLEAVGLWERRHHSLHQLSGGEQQRTAIAVGLANKPVLLLADEPTGEVDTVTAQSILDTFRRLNQQYNLTIVTVTHDLRVSNQVDRVVAIRDGRTSTERVRRVHEAVQVAEEDSAEGVGVEPSAAPEQIVTYHEYVVVDAAGRLQIPRDMLEKMGIAGRVEIEVDDDGIRIKPAQALATTTAQAARASEAVDEWGAQPRTKDWRLRVSDAGKGLRGILGKSKNASSASKQDGQQS
ncbi:MAG: ATP-binding cassette domain-containing protein [Chloroflexi bacterium]|nr:ATP-binding cassette domain-containing protein [Chloroflexota bacterium]